MPTAFEDIMPTPELREQDAETSQVWLLRFSNSLAPISAIPPEILSLIFEFGQAIERDDAQSEDSSLLSTNLFEVLITHVSSHFRNVAISTCMLWTSIDISPARSTEEISTYLSRSNHCQLFIRIDLEGELSLSARTMANIEIALHHLYRYRSFVIVSGPESLGNHIMHCLSGVDAPTLEHLSIDIRNDDVGYLAGSDVGILRKGAPRLSFVRLRGLAMSLFRPPLENVTTLHIDQTEPLPILVETFRRMVTASPHLANLSVYGDIINVQQTWPGSSNPIELPSLRQLRICGVDGMIYPGLLLGINAPGLESLVLKDVSASGCLLIEAYKNIFQVFPLITSFTTTHFTSIPRILLELAEPASEMNDIPWPELHTLTFLLNLSDADLIEDVLRGRQASGHPLTRLRLGTVHSLSALQQYDWQRDNVVVEKFDHFDQWPFASYGIDSNWDDDLFN
ncbi:hypothetical protein Hypma_001154 [Hypsizygus marmoreus]|uniref:F-box domain-containing protein n=1 Tax=Hypsizygus marmoreus TaxID=39966 RepID=A0A369J6N6_HYPMA|nr:hypothetical protein Hypma_001154 [Hypsizygus marmoreus]